MMKKYICLVLPFLFLTGCSIRDTSVKSFTCENHFELGRDSASKYPEQGDYFTIIESSYLDLYYYDFNNYNCHYYMKYKTGEVIDKCGKYLTDGRKITIHFEDDTSMVFYFNNYTSPTIDFTAITYFSYEKSNYYLIYFARYIFTSKG